MANQSYRYPASGSSSGSNASVGLSGNPVPTSATLVAGKNPSGQLQDVSTDSSGNVNVNVVSSALPTGAATAANQTSEITQLTAINTNTTGVATSANQTSEITQLTNISGKLPATLGSKTSANSLAVVIASDQASLPLPTGAATSANQATEIASLSTIATNSGTQATAANQTSGNASLTTIASNTSNTQGSATGGTQASKSDLAGGIYNSTLPTLTTGQQASLQLDSNARQIMAPLQAGSASIGSLINISGTVSLPTGAATSALQSAVAGSASGGTAAVSSELGGAIYNSTLPTLTNGQQAALQSDSKGRQLSITSTPIALTVTNAAITVGTTAVRLTVSGSAPAATRVVLVASPDTASTATFYVGTSTVTNSGATRGIPIVAGQSFIANSDAGDYWVVSSLASQTIEIMEQS